MIIAHDFPPNYVEIYAAFGKLPRGVFFCYGDTIYAPGGNDPDDSLIAHEEIHSGRQGVDPAGWWERYIAEPDFRLAEEVLAHRAEYLFLVATGIKRPQRRRELRLIAQRLCGPLYGGLIRYDGARALILNRV